MTVPFQQEIKDFSLETKRRRRRMVLSRIPECLSKKIVQTSFCYRKEDFEEAFSLLYKRYRQVGLIPEYSEKIFFTPYQALPNSRVCIARSLETNRVTSTATLVIDSPLGLPSDCLYKDIIDKLRKDRGLLAEFTCLAAEPDIFSRNGLFYVFRLLYKYAIKNGVTDIVISIHPKHTAFYELILLFERVGSLRYYPNLIDAPAYLERLDLIEVRKKYEEAYLSFDEGKTFFDFFFEKKFPEDIVEISRPKNMSPEIFKYFFLEKTKKFYSLEQDFQEFFTKEYLKNLLEEKRLKSLVSVLP
ncbi:MAG: hypothetical protein Q9M37_10480 [Desulfonauticus sp.]|nr:hypothetical protein [Desulfonauticus sp.]